MSIIINQIGLNINENQIQLVEIAKKEDKIILENVDEEFFEESINDETKEPKFIHILQNAFNEIILRKPLNSNNIFVSIPNSYFKVFEIPTDKNLTKKDLDEYIAWEITKLFPTKNKDYFAINRTVLDSPDYESVKKFLIYVVPSYLLKRIHKFCVRNSLILKLIDNSHTSTIPLIIKNNSMSNVLSFHIENNILSALLLKTNKITAFNSKLVVSMNEIPNLIKKIIDEFEERKVISGNIDSFYLTGNSITNELNTAIEAANNISTKDLNPFSNIEINKDLISKKFITDYSKNFINATAMALRKV